MRQMIESGLVFTLAMAWVASAMAAPIGFLEAESADVLSANATLPPEDVDTGPLSFNTMLRLGTSASATWNNFGSVDLPNGTYYVAVRLWSLDDSSEGPAGRDASLYFDSVLVGRTFEVQDDNQFHWYLLKDSTNTTPQTVTIGAGTSVPLTIGRSTSQSPYIDTIAFLDSSDVLPADAVPNQPDGGYEPQLPVPEPSGLALIGVAVLATLRRRP